MDIIENLDNDNITISINGEIDGSNVGELESTLKSAIDKASSMVLNLENLEYVSSAGLRVFLLIQKLAKAAGKNIVFRNVTEDVMEIFSVTGFVKLLKIE